MDTQTIKNRILSGDISEGELEKLLADKSDSHVHKQKGSFLKTILKGFIDAYTAPNMWRLTLQAVIICLVIIGIVILSYAGRIDAMQTAVLLAFILGFLFGKIK